MAEENESNKKVAGGAGITAGRDVSVKDVPGQVAIGEHIYQVNLIYNDYSSSLEQGKFDDIPEKWPEQLNNHLARIKEAESGRTKLSTDVYYTLGLSAYYERKFDEAESYLIKAIEENPNNLQARNLICRIYATRSLQHLSNRRYEDVINDSKKAESYFQYQSIAESFITMGYVYKNMYLVNREKEYIEKAKEKFEIALAIEDPKDVCNIGGAWNGIGNYYSLMGNNDMAINKHLEALKILPEYAEAHNDLAMVYETKMGEKGSNIDEWRHKAIEEWKKALSFGKDSPNFSEDYLANIKIRIQGLEAEKELREDIRINPNDLRAHSNLGTLLMELKRYEEAEKEYREAIKINPNFAEAHANLGVLVWQTGRKSEAEEHFNKTLALRPDWKDWVEDIKRS